MSDTSASLPDPRRRRMVMAGLTTPFLAAAAPALAERRGPPTRILVYGDSNTWGWRPTAKGFPTERFDGSIRWPRVLSRLLGERFEVVENGLNLRTTDLDDPVGSGEPGAQVSGSDFNGLRLLAPTLAAHAPLDLVIIALGQNDLQSPFDRSASQIAAAALRLAAAVRASAGEIGTTYPAPFPILISPPPLGERLHPLLGGRLMGARSRSLDLSEAFEKAAGMADAPLIDGGAAIGPAGGIDGRHFTASQHRRLAQAVSAIVRALTDRAAGAAQR